MPEITFIIPTVSNFKGLVRCIDTIYKYHEPDSFRIFVIDNSGKGLASQALPEGRAHLIIESYRNLGFGKSNNIGVKLAETPYVIIINDDVELVNKAWWPNIKEVFSRKGCEKVLAVAPSSIKGFPKSPEMDLLPYKEEYTQEDWNYLMSEKNRMPETLGWGRKPFKPSWIFDGTMFFCVVFKRETFDNVGMFDEGFWPGGCFLPNTSVLMSDLSYKLIQHLKVGDDLISDRSKKRKIRRVFKRNFEGTILKFILSDFSRVSLTPDHKIFVIENGSIKKKFAGKLKKGEQLYSPKIIRKNFLFLLNIETKEYDGLVYDFNIEKDHSYVVNSFAVSNSGDDYDYCRRIVLKGHRIVQTCNSFVYHHWRTSIGSFKTTEEEIRKYRRWNEGFDGKWNYEGEKTANIYGQGGKKDVSTIFMPI